jgi:hypothetical protein
MLWDIDAGLYAPLPAWVARTSQVPAVKKTTFDGTAVSNLQTVFKPEVIE